MARCRASCYPAPSQKWSQGQTLPRSTLAEIEARCAFGRDLLGKSVKNLSSSESARGAGHRRWAEATREPEGTAHAELARRLHAVDGPLWTIAALSEPAEPLQLQIAPRSLVSCRLPQCRACAGRRLHRNVENPSRRRGSGKSGEFSPSTRLLLQSGSQVEVRITTL
jgi:hypothetical protein